MQLKLQSSTVWFNTMPTIGKGGHALPTVDVAIEPGEVLPEGDYTMEVRLKGPDGKELAATTKFEVSHAY